MLQFFWPKLMAIWNGSVMIFWHVFARSLSWKSNLDCVRLNILDAEFSDVSIIRPGHDAGDHKDWNPSEKCWSKDNEQKHTSTATRAHRIILCMKRCPYRPSLKKRQSWKPLRRRPLFNQSWSNLWYLQQILLRPASARSWHRRRPHKDSTSWCLPPIFQLKRVLTWLMRQHALDFTFW